jgi:hypothetical protein
VSPVDDDRPGRGFWIGLALGTPVMVYGAFELIHEAGFPRAFAAARWLGAGLLLHDLVLVPIVLALVWAVGRVAPPRLRTPLRAGILCSALIVAIAWPALRGYGRRADNLSVHPLDYTSAVLTALVILWGAVVLWTAVSWRRQPSPPAR